MAERLKGKEQNKAQRKPRLGDILEQANEAHQRWLNAELFKALSGGDMPTDWGKVTMFVKIGANPDLLSLFHETALMMAIREKRYWECKKLLENGANPAAKNDDGKTAFDIFKTKRKRIFNLLVKTALRRINVEKPNDFVRAFRECIKG